MPRTNYQHSKKATTAKAPVLKNSDLIAESTKNKAALKEQLSRIKKGNPLIKTPHEEFKAAIAPTIENTPVVEAPIVETAVIEIPLTETTPIVEAAPVVETTPIVETPPEVITEAKNTITMFQDMVASTEQDKDQLSKLETIGDAFLDESSFGDAIEDSEEVRKTNAKIASGIWVTCIDVAAMLGCLFLSDDFSDESQRKFSLIPERKKAIQHSIYQLLMLRKKKTNPVFSLIIAILGSYAPMIVIAILGGRKKKEAQQAERQRQAQAAFDRANAPIQNAAAPIPDTSNFAPVNSEPVQSNRDIVENFGGGLKPQTRKVATKGRHKIGCNWYKDQPCNCRQKNFVRPR